jgi:hypothetical protein
MGNVDESGLERICNFLHSEAFGMKMSLFIQKYFYVVLKLFFLLVVLSASFGDAIK